jgi:hypothetical protein
MYFKWKYVGWVYLILLTCTETIVVFVHLCRLKCSGKNDVRWLLQIVLNVYVNHVYMGIFNVSSDMALVCTVFTIES